jgi:hypothetical protein
MIVRLVSAAAVVLMNWVQTAPLGAAEAVRLPMSCGYAANKVTLFPSLSDQFYVIIGDREHKTIRGCAPGATGRCRNWEVYRFDVMCGGRQVSWRLVAGQLLNLASSPEKRDALFRTHLEPWEVRSLLTEPEFAPVDEFGGRILSLADKSLPQRLSGRDAANARAEMATETATPAAGPPRSEQDTISRKNEPPKVAAATPLVQPEVSAQQPSGAMSHQPGAPAISAELKAQVEKVNIAASAPPAGKADAKPDASKPADVMALSQADGSKREGAPASDPEAAAAEPAASGAPAASDSTAQPEKSFSGFFPIVLASAIALTSVLVLVIISFLILGGMMWRKWASSRSRAHYGGIVRVVYEKEAAEVESAPDVDAAACRELMKQVAAELVNAMTAVNSLKGGPALQTALHGELESIRRSVGFTPQIRGTSGEKKDWKQTKSQLILSLQGAQRIIGIAEAARTSFASAHPAALEVITTRLEAYAFLGVNANASEIAMKKAVNALRECWHPDLAANEEDRRLREVRIKQINVAWDLISGKQMSY